MLELDFNVIDVRVEPNAVGPTLVFGLRIATPFGGTVHAIALRARIQIEARRRRYTPDEEAGLSELFGTPDRWHDTLRAVPWADIALMVPGFEGEVTVGLRVPCTYDMEVASTKYLHGVDGAGVPLQFFFSGTLFVRGPAGFGVEQLSRDLDASWAMPADTWRALMRAYFPDAAWLRLRHDRFDALARYKADRALPTWDATIDDLMATAALGAAGDRPTAAP